ncbi:MAG TPA: carboxypeptidase regulatory-like domain-containing protein [Pyrinomonadaceae bacterium]|nr:carboxypeptidase regulatory-like domain-containing protein [Pyrinomonadaceae bacterium]
MTLLLFCAAIGNVARARDLDDATISGRVTDETGAVIPGATVTAVRAANNLERNIVADDEGRYKFLELEPGAYTVRAAFAGFAAEEKRGLTIIAGQNVRLDFTLRPAGVSAEETIVSEADAPPVDTTRTIVGGTVTREQIEALPLASRAALDFVFTLPGVTEEPLSTRDAAEDRDPNSSSAERTSTTPEEAGAFALSGGAAYSNNITIDGLDNNDDRAARERFQPSLEAIEEVQIITNQFSAEYGRASGGRVNLRTRGGTKDLRGRVFYFFRDEALDGNTFNNNRRGLSRLPLQQHNPGFTLSAPVRISRERFGPLGYDGRDRTFFFTAYEYNTTLDSALIDTLVPIESNSIFTLPAPTTLTGRRTEPSSTAPNQPAELAPFVEQVSTPLRNNIFTARVDHKFTDTHNGAFLYQLGRSKNLRQFGGGLRLAEALQGRTRNSDALAYTDNFVFSPTVVNQLRAQVSRLTPAVEASMSGNRPVVLISINDPLDNDDPFDRTGTLVAGSSTSGASDRRETRWQIQDALSVVAGAHSLKFGGDVQRIRSTFIDLSDASGTYNFSSAGDFLVNSPSRFRQRFGTESIQRNTYLGFFAQDEWRLRRNLSISFGVRYERETILDDTNNWAPRVAAAFDPFDSGKTVIRFGAGIFFNRVLLRTIDDFTLGRQTIELDTNILPVAERRPFIAANLRFPETLTPDSAIIRSLGTALTDFSRRLDPNLRIPESYQLNVGFEREVGARVVVEGNYTFNRGVHLWREFNANAPRLPRGYENFNEYLASRDFPNFRTTGGTRLIYTAAAAGELVRFTNAPPDPNNPDAITRIVESGLPISVFNLNSVTSTTALEAALGALAGLRPDPARTQLEQLVSAGNSFYHGLTLEARRRFTQSSDGLAFSLRAAYTLSRLIDDGVVNTSSALVVGDFRGERARSLLDRRHRFVFSGVFDTPRFLGRVRFSPILRLASGAPFNISIGGVDRNLDDVSNDRPIFNGDVKTLRARRPEESLDPRLLTAFALPSIGQTGNLPRNAGRGPELFLFDLSVTREFRFNDSLRLRPVIEIDNLLNKTVFTFGAEFVNFNALRPTATAEQRQALLDTFLVPTRTLRPRSIRLGLRFDF